MSYYKEQIMATVHDLAADFVYYDRKEDELLNRDELQAAFKDGIVTVESVTAEFKKNLELWLKEEEDKS